MHFIFGFEIIESGNMNYDLTEALDIHQNAAENNTRSTRIQNIFLIAQTVELKQHLSWKQNKIQLLKMLLYLFSCMNLQFQRQLHQRYDISKISCSCWRWGNSFSTCILSPLITTFTLLNIQ